MDQKLFDDFSLLISIVVPILSKKLFTCLFGGQIGTGPLPIEIGGKGIALTILTFFFINFFNWANLIVDIKLIIFWLDLNFNLGIIWIPIFGVIAKKTQLHLSTISWLVFATETFLNFLLNFNALLLFLGETKIFLNAIFYPQIPFTTATVILPVPINPNFIIKPTIHKEWENGRKLSQNFNILIIY